MRAQISDRLHVRGTLHQRQDRHQFASNRDVEADLPGQPVAPPALHDRHVPQKAVVHVHHAPDLNAFGVDMERITVVPRVVHHRRDLIMRLPDRVNVTVEVQQACFQRNHLGLATARTVTFDPKHRTKRALPQRGAG